MKILLFFILLFILFLFNLRIKECYDSVEYQLKDLSLSAKQKVPVSNLPDVIIPTQTVPTPVLLNTLLI